MRSCEEQLTQGRTQEIQLVGAIYVKKNIGRWDKCKRKSHNNSQNLQGFFFKKNSLTFSDMVGASGP